MDMNRRNFARIRFETNARLYIGTEEQSVEILDLSLKGALIKPSQPLQVSPHTPAALQIRLDELGPLIRMEGTITHHHGEMFGMACEEIDLDSITHLRRLVELNLGDEALLERELCHLIGL